MKFEIKERMQRTMHAVVAVGLGLMLVVVGALVVLAVQRHSRDAARQRDAVIAVATYQQQSRKVGGAWVGDDVLRRSLHGKLSPYIRPAAVRIDPGSPAAAAPQTDHMLLVRGKRCKTGGESAARYQLHDGAKGGVAAVVRLEAGGRGMYFCWDGS